MVNKRLSTRHFLGDPEGTNLCNWMNASENSKELRFVVEVLEAGKLANNNSIHAALFRKKLTGISITPVPMSSPEYGNWISWRVGKESHSRKEAQLEIESWWELFGVGDALFAIMALWQQNLINRIRRCPCGNWFYGRFAHSQYCSLECQQKFVNKTDKFRARRRRYMREYLRERRAKKK